MLKTYTICFNLPSGDKIKTQELDEETYKFIIEYLAKPIDPAMDPAIQVPRGEVQDKDKALYVRRSMIEAYEIETIQHPEVKMREPKDPNAPKMKPQISEASGVASGDEKTDRLGELL